MYCPIHNPSGGDYDPQKSQYKKRRHALMQEYGKGQVTLISTEKIPVVQKPYTPPEFFKADAPSVVQLDNTKKILSDFAAITVTFGDEAKKTFVFNVKFLPSNSPARGIITALQYLTEERLYSRHERWVKQQRPNTRWDKSPSYASVDIVRCFDEGRRHSPASPGPVIGERMWEFTGATQGVISQFAYLTGYNQKMIAMDESTVFEVIQDQVNTIAKQQNMTTEERAMLLKDRIAKVNKEMFTHYKDSSEYPSTMNDVIIHKLDLVGAAVEWVGPNTVDTVFLTTENTADLREWFMDHDAFYVANQQMFVDLGYKPAEFLADDSIYIKSNVRINPFYINEERVFVETRSEQEMVFTNW